MKTNKKLFVGLLAISAFLGACSLFSVAMVKDIPPSHFEDTRGEGERLVYVTVERADAKESGYNGSTRLCIATDNTVIAALTDPYGSDPAKKIISPAVYDSVSVYERGLAVFSLPKSQGNIGLSYYCDEPVEGQGKEVATGVTVNLNPKSKYSTGHSTYKIPPEAGDIAITVTLRTTGIETFKVLTSTDNDEIKQIVLGCNQYGSWTMPEKYGGKGTPGFIAPPEKKKK